jgi:hypothetical protein
MLLIDRITAAKEMAMNQKQVVVRNSEPINASHGFISVRVKSRLTEL